MKILDKIREHQKKLYDPNRKSIGISSPSKFFKPILVIGLAGYILVSLVINLDYLNNNYGGYKKFFTCAIGKSGINDDIKKSVVRIVGGYSEGSGFFIKPNKIVTNFHVIADEPSPKIIFPDGTFIVPEKIVGDKDMDVAVISTEKEYPEMVLDTVSGQETSLDENEALFATGYAMGTDLTGNASQLKGNFVDVRKISHSVYDYIQTNISLAEGMSGGPLTDQCGTVVGMNKSGVGGLSLFVPVFTEFSDTDKFTDKDIEKIKVDPAASPEEAVKAFYTYLKARKMEEGFKLLSKEYLLNTNFEEWSDRFSDVIDVDLITAEKYEETTDTVFVKFSTKNWIKIEADDHYYEGTWKTIPEDGINKLLKSNIKEVDDPEFEWFY